MHDLEMSRSRQWYIGLARSYTIVDVQVTDEGGRDKEFPECLFCWLWQTHKNIQVNV